MLLGNSIKHPTEECIDGITMFVLNLYCKNRPTDISNLSELQWHMFSKKGLESDKLPPTFSALKHTIHWSYYMTYIWKSAISTNPIYGRQTSAPQSVIELSMCSCKKTNCDSLRCNMYQCLNCSNIEFDKPEFKWEITSVCADELSAAQTLLIEEGFFIASSID